MSRTLAVLYRDNTRTVGTEIKPVILAITNMLYLKVQCVFYVTIPT